MNRKIRVIVADDEQLAREAVTLRLGLNPQFELVAQADNGEDAVLLCATLQPDVIFLDINMPKLSGLEASDKLPPRVKIVFITAYDEFAVQAFRKNALDYLVKPIKDNEFHEVLEKINAQLAQQEQLEDLAKLEHTKYSNSDKFLKRISIKIDGEYRLFDTTSIDSVQSVKDYLCLKINGQTYIIRQTMKELTALLDPALFVRCHQSHLVNIQKTTRIFKQNTQDYLLCAEEKVPISRRLKHGVLEALEKGTKRL